ncbi:MAG: hypothetical protein HY323_10135, partial [Betaproteobacteria bacterium]|nr:hypothetical protein [Betaproteobacteria bacterium]
MTPNLALLKESPASRLALRMLLSICLAIAGCGGIETRPGGDADSSSAEGSVPADRSPLGQAVDTAFVCQNFEYSRADFLTGLRSALRTASGEICEQSFLRQLESLLEDDFRRFQASLARFKSDVATAIGRIGDEQIKSLQSLGAQGRRVRQNLQKCVAAIKSYDPEPAATLLAASRPVF